jgi:hypothetical protein
MVRILATNNAGENDGQNVIITKTVKLNGDFALHDDPD